MPIFVVELDQTPATADGIVREVEISDTEVVVGRKFLGFRCIDNRISRTHGLLVRGEDTVTLRCTHSNPLFYRTPEFGREAQQINYNASAELRHNDEFGLLKERFWYKITVRGQPESSEPPENRVGSMLRIRPPDELNLSQNLPFLQQVVSNGFQEPNEAGNVDQQVPNCDNAIKIEPAEPSADDPEMDADNDVTQLVPQPQPIADVDVAEPGSSSSNVAGEVVTFKRQHDWEKVGTQGIGSTTDENGEPSPKRVHLEESQLSHGEATPAPQPVPVVEPPIVAPQSADVNPPAQVPQADANEEPSTSTNDGQTVNVKTEDVKPTIKKEEADTSTLRDSCEFGIRCYRQNPDHRAEMAHPGDRDYRRPNLPPAPSGAPPCNFGAACYRRNPQHFIDFSHPDSTQSNVPPVQPPPGIMLQPRPRGIYIDMDVDSDVEEEEADFGASSDEEFVPANFVDDEFDEASDEDYDEVSDLDPDDNGEGQPNEE